MWLWWCGRGVQFITSTREFNDVATVRFLKETNLSPYTACYHGIRLKSVRML
jgi:hypothetical protein